MIAKLLLLELGSEKLALEIGEVLGILEEPRLFPLPRLPREFPAVLLHRGEPVPLLVPPGILAENGIPAGEATLVLLCNTTDGTVGLPARRVVKIVDSDAVHWLDGEPGAASGEPRRSLRWEGRRFQLLNIDVLVRGVAPETQAGIAQGDATGGRHEQETAPR